MKGKCLRCNVVIDAGPELSPFCISCHDRFVICRVCGEIKWRNQSTDIVWYEGACCDCKGDDNSG